MTQDPVQLPDEPAARHEVAILDRDSSHMVDLTPAPGTLQALARLLGVEGLRDLRLAGTLGAEGRAGWRFDGRLTARLDQSCVVTLQPVVQDIDEEVTRLWQPGAGETAAEAEVEADGPETPEPLGDTIELMPVILETLALAADPYPRAAGAELERTVFGPADKAPLTDEAARPFAALAALKSRLTGGS